VREYVLREAKGIYVVELDHHAGLIINYGKDMVRFVHSNYYLPVESVVSEDLNSVKPLRDSKYRVVGKLLDDKRVRRWLSGERIGLRYHYFARWKR
jgi:hypothetical protein